MSKALYFECNSGISGDMTVAALLDLGADEKALRDVLSTIPIEGYKIEISRVKKAGIDCCDFNVILDEQHENHDHDMEYLHGHSHDESKEEHPHGHSHDEPMEDSFHGHSHNELIDEHDHVQTGESHHHHEHRGLDEIMAILMETKLTEGARKIAIKIFDILAEAEAKAHALPKDRVHFHEVGAVDSIVDIVAVAVCVDNLGISEVYVPKVCEGSGVIRCQHGILPIPVPATANIAARYGITLEMTETKGELVTPTGAAIIAALRTAEELPSGFKIDKIGLGAGKRSYERPSILRAMIIEAEEALTINLDDDKKPEYAAGEMPTAPSLDYVYKLESDIDDCTGEALGYVMEKLFEAGARDVHYSPVFMKKNRPGWQLNVICTKEKVSELEKIIFTETTTIGIRRFKYERSILERKIEAVNTLYGEAKVKVCTLDEIKKVYPEYETVTALCRKTGKSFDEIFRLVLDSYEKDCEK